QIILRLGLEVRGTRAVPPRADGGERAAGFRRVWPPAESRVAVSRDPTRQARRRIDRRCDELSRSAALYGLRVPCRPAGRGRRGATSASTVIGMSDAPPRAPRPASARELLRWQFRLAHALLEGAIERFSSQAVHRCACGRHALARACYARGVFCEDLSVNGVLTAGTPLAFSTWAGRTGLSEVPPLGGTSVWRAWARRVRLDQVRLRP